MNPWSGPAQQSAFRWLETLLHERFGVPLRVSPGTASGVTLYLTGYSQQIAFSACPELWVPGAHSASYTTWLGLEEGWVPPLAGTVPAPGAVVLPTPLITPLPDGGFRIGYDIPSLCYWMLNRVEELGRKDLDGHGRFPATASHAFKHGYLERPVVDEWLSVLGQVIKRTWPGVGLVDPVFTTVVSHDVDGPSRYAFRTNYLMLRGFAGDLVRRRDPVAALRGPFIRRASKARLHQADPNNTFDWLMDQSESRGLKSAFYFICGRTDPRRDADYDPEHPSIRELMRRIHSRGHEIGLHPSYGTYQRPDLIKFEAERLHKVSQDEGIAQGRWGGRMHYLRWEHPTTLYGWEAAGMDYESTLGFADRPGFRCGTCFEYSGYDPVARRTLMVRIRPLVAMDCTVMAARYMGLGPSQAALDHFLRLKAACRAVGGTFTTLWHNTEVIEEDKRRIYTSLLDG